MKQIICVSRDTCCMYHRDGSAVNTTAPPPPPAGRNSLAFIRLPHLVGVRSCLPLAALLALVGKPCSFHRSRAKQWGGGGSLLKTLKLDPWGLRGEVGAGSASRSRAFRPARTCPGLGQAAWPLGAQCSPLYGWDNNVGRG